MKKSFTVEPTDTGDVRVNGVPVFSGNTIDEQKQLISSILWEEQSFAEGINVIISIKDFTELILGWSVNPATLVKSSENSLSLWGLQWVLKDKSGAVTNKKLNDFINRVTGDNCPFVSIEDMRNKFMQPNVLYKHIKQTSSVDGFYSAWPRTFIHFLSHLQTIGVNAQDIWFDQIEPSMKLVEYFHPWNYRSFVEFKEHTFEDLVWDGNHVWHENMPGRWSAQFSFAIAVGIYRAWLTIPK